jgi:hypothetical protein
MLHMKRTFTLLAVSMLLSKLSAQITIGTSHMPKSNDTLRYSEAALTSSVDYRKSGASQTWDFRSLQPNGQGLYEYKSAVQVNPAYLFWGLTTYGLKIADSIGFGTFQIRNVYDFYRNSSSKFTAEGRGLTFSGFPIPSDYSDPDEIYQFPLEFGDRDSSRFKVRFQLSTFFTLVQEGYRINEVIGWGTVRTPYGDFNCLQVKTRIVEVDTVITSFGRIPVPRNQVQYKFLSTSERMPIFEASGTEVGGNFTPQFLRYRDQYRGLQSALRPRASFRVSKSSGFVGDTFNITDASTNVPTGWNWQFTPSAGVRFVGGTTATSRNPRVVFNDRGSWNLKLTANNLFGADDTTVNNAISIAWGTNTADAQTETYAPFPIPAHDRIYLHPHVTGAVKMWDMQGRDCSAMLRRDGQTLWIDALPAGNYLLEAVVNGAAQRWRLMRE